MPETITLHPNWEGVFMALGFLVGFGFNSFLRWTAERQKKADTRRGADSS